VKPIKTEVLIFFYSWARSSARLFDLRFSPGKNPGKSPEGVRSQKALKWIERRPPKTKVMSSNLIGSEKRRGRETLPLHFPRSFLIPPPEFWKRVSPII